MPTLASTTLALSLAAATYLHARCITDPNPPPADKSRAKTDRISFVVGSFHVLSRRVIIAASLYHALLVFYYPGTTATPHDHSPQSKPEEEIPRLPFCPHPANLSAALFTWSPITITSLVCMFLGAAIRLSAFGGLGPFFTFSLSAPDRLVTDGIYRFVQHPSYTGQTLLMVPGLALVFNWEAGPACFLDEWVLRWLRGWGAWVIVVALGVMVGVLMLRVRDEERLLKDKFGEEWVAWNRRTKRFVPGVF